MALSWRLGTSTSHDVSVNSLLSCTFVYFANCSPLLRHWALTSFSVIPLCSSRWCAFTLTGDTSTYFFEIPLVSILAGRSLFANTMLARTKVSIMHHWQILTSKALRRNVVPEFYPCMEALVVSSTFVKLVFTRIVFAAAVFQSIVAVRLLCYLQSVCVSTYFFRYEMSRRLS